MTETIHPLIGLAPLAWAVISVIWLTLALGALRGAREDARAMRKSRTFYREQMLKREDRIAELVETIREKDRMISHLGFELDRIYIQEIAAVPPADTRSNTDKVLDYYRG